MHVNVVDRKWRRFTFSTVCFLGHVKIDIFDIFEVVVIIFSTKNDNLILTISPPPNAQI